MRILGLDPGLKCTGWGIIEWKDGTLYYIAHGTITTSPTDGTPLRLAKLFEHLDQVCRDYTPDQAAIEDIFVNKNPTSSLKLSLARGVVMMTPALHHLLVTEYPSTTVKKTVVGRGHADKSQVAHMVRFFLPKAQNLSSDASDALAIAICHAHHTNSLARLAGQ